MKASADLQAADIEVLGMVAIFTYGFGIADDNFENANIELTCLSNYSVMLEKALELGHIAEEAVPSLEEWRKDPSTWNG